MRCSVRNPKRGEERVNYAGRQRERLLQIEELHTYFPLEEGIVRAVNGASFTVDRGQTVGVVGESGCGKSAMARSILRIVPRPGKIVAGKILYYRPWLVDNGRADTNVIDLATLDPKGREIRRIRGAEISMVFQEPMSTLSPVHTVGDQIMEAVRLHQNVSQAEARHITINMLERVGMPQPNVIIDRYPYKLSGGMRQRAMIAMALSCRPNLLIADEPTTALDVTTQAQILSLMRDLQNEMGMAILFITHDLGVIAQMTEFVLVMYLGEIVESARVDALFYAPKHPYTEGLMTSIPRLGEQTDAPLNTIPGNVPDPYSLPPGCPFHPRCPFNDHDRCMREAPALREVTPGHMARCHYAGELPLAGIDQWPAAAAAVPGADRQPS
jgi:peptide/nickel transport system ATP-binding protein